MRARVVHLLVVLALLAPVVGACGYREEKRLERMFNDISKRLETAGTARFTIKTVIDPSRAEEPAFRLPLRFEGEGTLDFRNTRATVTIPGQAEPVLIYDDVRIYARRAAAVLQNDPRKWGMLDFGDRDVGTDVRSALGLNAVNPAILVELARGTAIGGITTTTEEVRGVTTTRYNSRIAPLVAMEDHSAELRDALRRATSAAMGVRETIYPGAVWLDGEGLPRRIRFTMTQRVDRANPFATTYDLEIFDFGAPLTIEPPKQTETLVTKSFGGLTATIDIPRRAAPPPAPVVTTPESPTTTAAPPESPTTTAAPPPPGP